VGSVPLSQLAERFGLQQLIGKWANVYTEELTPHVKNLTVVNNLVGESDWVFVDRKHKPPVRMRSLKCMIFACNALPQVTSWSGGVMEAFLARLSVIIMEAPENFKPVKNVADTVPKGEAFEFLLWCRRQLEEREWEVRKRDREVLMDMVLQAQNPVFRFISERCARNPQARIERGRLYDEYVRWCADNGITKLLSRTEFYTVVRSMGYAEKKASEGRRFFIGLELISDTARRMEAEVERWLEGA